MLFNAKESYVMGKMYALFVSEEVLEPSMDNEMILTGVGHNKGRRLDRTLGTLIKTDFAKKEIISEYMKIIDIIFCKLNIRNCIMHGIIRIIFPDKFYIVPGTNKLTAEVEAIQKDIKEKKANLKIKKSGWKTHVFSLVNDMFTERQNDESSYKELASQHDMDAF